MGRANIDEVDLKRLEVARAIFRTECVGSQGCGIGGDEHDEYLTRVKYLTRLGIFGARGDGVVVC